MEKESLNKNNWSGGGKTTGPLSKRNDGHLARSQDEQYTELVDTKHLWNSLYQTVETLLIFHQLGENVKIVLVCLWLYSVKINRKRVGGGERGGQISQISLPTSARVPFIRYWRRRCLSTDARTPRRLTPTVFQTCKFQWHSRENTGTN